jgi:hypothetical protein
LLKVALNTITTTNKKNYSSEILLWPRNYLVCHIFTDSGINTTVNSYKFIVGGPVASNWQTLSHNVVSSTPCMNGIRTHNISLHLIYILHIYFVNININDTITTTNKRIYSSEILLWSRNYLVCHIFTDSGINTTVNIYYIFILWISILMNTN